MKKWIIALLVIISVVAISPAFAQKTAAARKWVLIEKNALHSQQDIYVDINSRKKSEDGMVYIVTLYNNYKPKEVTIFNTDNNGNQTEVSLRGKIYLSILHVEIFDCERKKSASISSYRSNAMGNGKEVYRDDEIIFIPVMPIFQDKIFSFACQKSLTKK
jgi:hypothetical protein